MLLYTAAVNGVFAFLIAGGLLLPWLTQGMALPAEWELGGMTGRASRVMAVPVVAGYALGNFVPYAGILYKDYTMKDRYEFTKTYAGEDYTVRIDETFHARHKLYALAGVNYFLADNISLGVNGSFGNRQSVQLQFNISF